jgi:hypothetical protein
MNIINDYFINKLSKSCFKEGITGQLFWDISRVGSTTVP